MTLGAMTIVTANIAGTSGSYVTGDNIGTITSLTSAVSSSGGSGVIEHITVWDDADALLQFDLYFCKATISPGSDSAAFAPSDSDNRLIVARAQFPSPEDHGGARYIDLDCAKNIKCNATTLFVCCVARATIGTIAANAIGMEVYIRQDQ